MRKIIVNFVFIVLCLLLFFYRYEIISTYLSYKYPSPAVFSGLILPIEKGEIYISSEKSINIFNPLNDSYSILITKNFSLASGDELAKYLEQLNHNLVEIKTVDHGDMKYFKATSIDRQWFFNVFIYFPEQNIMASYRGSKNDYPRFDKIITKNWGQIPVFTSLKKGEQAPIKE